MTRPSITANEGENKGITPTSDIILPTSMSNPNVEPQRSKGQNLETDIKK